MSHSRKIQVGNPQVFSVGLLLCLLYKWVVEKYFPYLNNMPLDVLVFSIGSDIIMLSNIMLISIQTCFYLFAVIWA
jgi:hypothetical protein